jgi:hypothetical protein
LLNASPMLRLALALVASIVVAACSSTRTTSDACTRESVSPSTPPTTSDREVSTLPDGGTTPASTLRLSVGDELSRAYCEGVCHVCGIGTTCSIVTVTPTIVVGCIGIGGG